MGGGNLEKTCPICLKTMRGDNLKWHTKCHKKIDSIDETHTTSTAGEMKHVDQAGTNRRVVSSE